jgi:hypothetical protein
VIDTCRTNLDARFSRVEGLAAVEHVARSTWSLPPTGATVRGVRLNVFARHNHDDRLDGQLRRSISVGDVVTFGELAVSDNDIGFTCVGLARADLVVDRTCGQIDQDWSATAPSTVALTHDRGRPDAAHAAARSGADADGASWSVDRSAGIALVRIPHTSEPHRGPCGARRPPRPRQGDSACVGAAGEAALRAPATRKWA